MILKAAFFLHVGLSALLLVTMDMDMPFSWLETPRNMLVDGYEVLGLGNFFLGVGGLAAVLGVLCLLARRDRRGQPKS